MQQEVVLAMLAKEPSHGYEPSARRRQALGSLREALNPGQRLCHPDPAREGWPGDLRAGGGPGGLAAPRAAAPAARRQRAALAQPENSDAVLLLEGIVLRLQADLCWLEACEQNWTGGRSR